MSKVADLNAKWNTIAMKEMRGRTIVHTKYMTSEDVKAMGWYRSGLVLFLDNGAQVFVQQDDEGNGPGALLVTYENDDVLLPTL